MKIPNRIKVGAHTFKVLEVKKNDLSDPECLGACDPETLTITILETLPYSFKLSTLFHEIIHAINWTFDEDIVESFSQQMVQVLLENDLIK